MNHFKNLDFKIEDIQEIKVQKADDIALMLPDLDDIDIN